MAYKVNKEKCIGCGACTGECPVGAAVLSNDGLAEIKADECLSCGACEAACPNEAISAE